MTYTLADILQNTSYDLNIFNAEEIAALEIYDKKGKPYIKDFADKKERPAKPEEIVRQLYIYRLLNTYKYPPSRIAIEHGVQMGHDIHDKRADIVIFDKDDPKAAYIIIEVKKPKRKDGVEQLKSYCTSTGAVAAVWTNGGAEVIMRREQTYHGATTYVELSDIPRADQTMRDVIGQRVTIDELERRNKLVTEKTTLTEIIKDLENLVLANAGVDAFEEIFKLVYAKLYDEYRASNGEKEKDRYVEFRADSESDTQIYDRISQLFEDAKDEWKGAFLKGEKIDLPPEALRTCVSFLQDVKLFNSNLHVIDDAFEYLSVEVAKGNKGQYFTPRPIIDMCVKMLDPKPTEYVIDTAAGSCGFTFHTIFHVWGGELTAKGPTQKQRDYASKYVYGLDFDARSVKIAKALNLIAGDGRTNVFRVNTLAPHTWGEEERVALRRMLREFDSAPQNKDNREKLRDFDFDVVMTNPPFAGDVSDGRILAQYELAKGWKGVDIESLTDEAEREKYRDSWSRLIFQEAGKRPDRASRDILFVERNLQFLKPGGRMAIVLPQGRFNNVSDARLRSYIAEHARILAVVGLHGNSFKPHTGTKTSVLFLQKWQDNPKDKNYCPRVNDYPIFFAVNSEPVKDNSGDYIHYMDENGQNLLDLYGHEIVSHDLYDVRVVLKNQMSKKREALKSEPAALVLLEDHYKKLLETLPQRQTIAEAFREFALKHKFSFIEEDEN
ncbi:SAM-dependent methyltransferase [bacterium]|nr:MAG: SAM-dependent methyltransferase [bacterium]